MIQKTITKMARKKNEFEWYNWGDSISMQLPKSDKQSSRNRAHFNNGVLSIDYTLLLTDYIDDKAAYKKLLPLLRNHFKVKKYILCVDNLWSQDEKHYVGIEYYCKTFQQPTGDEIRSAIEILHKVAQECLKCLE